MIDLFAGIGGFSLAAHWAGFGTDIFVEREKYCQKVLRKNFPNIPIVDDIFDFNIKLYEELTGKQTTDIISGGFPCQPFSLAGKRKGKEDDRYLWGEMFRVITEIRPRWVIAENVYGIVNISDGLVFEQVHTDLESENYQVQSFIIPASSKNAPHRRDRVWFVGYTDDFGRNSGRSSWKERQIYPEQQGEYEKNKRTRDERQYRVSPFGEVGNVTDTNNRSRQKHRFSTRGEMLKNGVAGNGIVTDTNTKRLQRGANKGKDGRERAIPDEPPGRIGGLWEKFPTQPPICGGNDGIPNRVDRIKALGNAIVPQIAYEIFRTIREIENE